MAKHIFTKTKLNSDFLKDISHYVIAVLFISLSVRNIIIVFANIMSINDLAVFNIYKT